MFAKEFLMPAEWEQHRATWLAWPHQEADWPGKISCIDWVYTEIVRALSKSESVEIICHDQLIKEKAKHCLTQNNVAEDQYRLLLAKNDRSWLRDSGPTAVKNSQGEIEWIGWLFNAWAKYDNYLEDQGIPEFISKISKHKLHQAFRPDNNEPLVLEGGGIEADGQGTLLVTEEWLLSEVQIRNPGLTREGYQNAFRKYLGIEKTIWLSRGCAGDDTHGHIDDVARFVAPGQVVLAFEENEDDENHIVSVENLEILSSATDATEGKLEVIKLPMPRPIIFDSQRLPASYANFYIANSVVLVPTFNDENDKLALGILSELFPERRIVGIHSVDLVWGLGTLHCLSQQEPLGR